MDGLNQVLLKQLQCWLRTERSESRWSLAKDDLMKTGTRLIQLKDEDVVECRPYYHEFAGSASPNKDSDSKILDKLQVVGRN